MVWDRQRIEEDLRGLLDGEVHCDQASTALYSTDGSIFQIEPTGVVRPRHIADVMACVEYSNHHKIPLHPRGAGSGVSGESLGPGLAIDFSTHFRRIEVRDDDTIRVQPGVVLSTLNSWLANRGRVFGPDPATASVATVGGVLGRNSSGSRYVAYGSTRDCTEQIQVVLADGQLVELNRNAQSNSIDTNTRTSELKSRLQHVIETRANAHPTCESIPEGLRPAYALPHSQSSEPIDLMSLMVGSEGT